MRFQRSSGIVRGRHLYLYLYTTEVYNNDYVIITLLTLSLTQEIFWVLTDSGGSSVPVSITVTFTFSYTFAEMSQSDIVADILQI